MKVVQINSVCGTGSTGRIATDISKIMTENEIENYILYGVGLSDYPLGIKIGNNFNIRTHQLHTRLLGWHGYASHLATRQLIRELERINPDIIHLHNIHGFYLNIEILFRYLAVFDKPVVWTLHDCWAFTGHCAYFDYAQCDKWRIGCGACPQKKSYPVSWLFDHSLESWKRKRELFTIVRNMHIVTPSQWLADLVKHSFLKDYPVEVIHNGIDLDVFQPTDSSFREKNTLQDKFIILGVASSWGRRKGLSYFLQLANDLDEKFRIVLVGLTHKQKANLPQSIIGVTRTNNVKELAELYSAADVFVNPTLEDNFPTVNLEALACGTPVITFNTGGSPEALDDACGIGVDKGNVDELVAAIINISNHGILQQSCISRVNKFDKQAKFMAYIDLYNQEEVKS